MADAIERLYRLTVDANAAIAQLEKLNRASKDTGDKLGALASTVEKAGKAFLAGFAIDVLLDKFTAITESMDAVVKAAQEVGVSAAALQKLQYAAAGSGSSAETLGKGLEKLSVNLQDVESGSTEAQKALLAMGVTSKDTADQALAKISDAFAKLPDGAQKTALAVAIFGKAGAELIPMLNNGRAGLKAMGDEARELGLVMDGNALKAAEHFRDQLDLLANISKASAQSFVSGMIPALEAIASVLIDAKKGGEGFSSWGEAAGSLFLLLAKGAETAATAFKDIVRILGAVGEALVNPLHIGDVWNSMVEDLGKNSTDLAEQWAELDRRFEDFTNKQKAFVGPPEQAKTSTLNLKTANDLLAESAKRAEEAYKQFEKTLQEEARSLGVAEKAAKAATEAFQKTPEGHLTKVIDDQQKAAEEWNLTVDDSVKKEQIWRDMLDNGTEDQKKYAHAMLDSAEASKKWGEQTSGMSDELKIIGEGFGNFFDNLARGTASAADLFKRMVQSIIADLLKLWAQKYIVEFFFPSGGSAPAPGTGGKFALGGAFAGGNVLPFMAGGVVGSPTYFRMAGARVGLMGEAGPEAILPLKRTSDGALGVRAQAAPLNVQIHNHTDAQVSARRDSDGTLQVVIEQAKLAVAADIRRGGNDIARAAEGAWRLSRGAAARF